MHYLRNIEIKIKTKIKDLSLNADALSVIVHEQTQAFSKFYRRHFDLVSKYNVGLQHFFCKVFLNQNFMATL